VYCCLVAKKYNFLPTLVPVILFMMFHANTPLIYSGFDFVVFRCKYLIYKLIAGILKFIAMKDVTILIFH